MNGKLIVIEGVDGSGKQTQSDMLYEKLTALNKKVYKVSFPNYASPSSALAKMYLEGEFGTNPGDVNAYASSIFYAVDRYATFKTQLKEYYENGYIIIADRYTTSNMVHQASKIDDKAQKDKFLDWLTELEFGIFGLPKPDAVIFLNIDPDISAELIKSRENKITHEQSKDIHERDADYLRKSYKNAEYVAKKYSWTILDCTNEGRLLSKESIHEKLLEAIGKII